MEKAEAAEAAPAPSSGAGGDLEMVGGGVGGGGEGEPPVMAKGSAGAAGGTRKRKSCKGYLYHSSQLKSQARNPICVGVTRALQQAPGYMVGESELEAVKEGSNLVNFKYSCIGYSVFMDNKDGNKDDTSEKGEKPAELPFCVGIEVLVDRRAPTPGHADNREDAPIYSQPRPPKPAHSIGEEFLSRFTRNAGLVAAGVSRNLYRVANHIKDNLDDILYPDRRRPK